MSRSLAWLKLWLAAISFGAQVRTDFHSRYLMQLSDDTLQHQIDNRCPVRNAMPRRLPGFLAVARIDYNRWHYPVMFGVILTK
ncbi:hypothetical protein [Hymenobacter cellulosivorans]|uniref:Uncharacterized protein n=1 Tax=Hymenobacter cellulosivorans TaxID=2932249 RepID=A0ABY4F8A3_9BACT|nr:hypothetical protein [Hymenobacter cellulosivorans]UOQ52885.1 hypothetical protein MUN80_24475 [Hymenobacter cellulosivorans]